MEYTKKRLIFYAVLVVIALSIVGYQQWIYEKYNASWNGISIYWWAALIAPCILIIMNLTMRLICALGSEYDFDYKRFVVGPHLFAFLFAGAILIPSIGIHYTEPDLSWSSNHSDVGQNDRFMMSMYYQTRGQAGSNNFAALLDMVSSDSDSDSSSDDKGGKLFAAAIIIIVLSMMILSATVQHFWVIGSIAVLLMMLHFLLLLYRQWKTEKTQPGKRFIRGR